MKDGATFRIVNLLTNRQWDVEAIQPRRNVRTEFGDSLDNYCAGAISEADSRISEETHRKVRMVDNPLDAAK